jgi:2,3-bisphosphoglycerate-independent phosphoglycerate mutase
MDFKFLQEHIVPAKTKIVLLILDGLGGLPREAGGRTELETACTPNLDALAQKSILGLTQPAGPGITVGSGPGHLAIFGYDPIEYEIGRGALEALGVNFELGPQDVAARGNFCSVDENGVITDRRAGRVPTEQARELVHLLRTIKVDGVEFFVEMVKEHRFAFVMRAPGLGDALSETDPLKTGATTLPVRALDCDSEKAACFANQFIEQARCLLADKHPANMITLRGFASLPRIPTYAELYGLHPAAIAINGMYRGVARLAGMEVLDVYGDTTADEFATLEKYWNDFDFFYMHVKKTDTCGEAGDFDGKVRVIEEVDALLPRLLALQPDVVIVGGDHSSPAVLKSHSWHPVPVLVYGEYVRPDGIAGFGEHACARGSLGVLPATNVIPIALANSGRIRKYGA